MKRFLGLLLLLLCCGGCQKEEPRPVVPTAPEDLSTWSVPELVQPPPPEGPVPQPPQDKPTPAEQVLDFVPNTTFSLTISIGAPLDIVLQRGEQVRNIIGGDRAPAEANQTTRWEIKEEADGLGDTLRQQKMSHRC